MINTETMQARQHQGNAATEHLPDKIHVVFSAHAADINEALREGFLQHQHDADIKRTHLFNGRYENIYLTPRQVPEIRELLEEACEHASRIVGIDQLQAGCWFNYMPPGAVTTRHSHDDDDELLSAVYYVSVPENSGKLIIHQHGRQYEVTPQEGKFVFFPPDVVHEVSKNMSSHDRLSIAINFGKPRHEDS